MEIKISRKLGFLFVAIFIMVLFFVGTVSFAEDLTPTPTPGGSSEKLNSLQNQIKELQSKVDELANQGKTLSSQISAMDNQIKLTQLRIAATKQEIEDLGGDIDTIGGKIVKLEGSLEKLSKSLIARIRASYETGSTPQLNMLLNAGSPHDFTTRLSYLRAAQAKDRELLLQTTQAKNDYSNQKQILEGKKEKVEALKTQLEGYTKQLDQDKVAKESLLAATKNDEKKYQSLLAQARAEYQAIQGIVAGYGTETEIGEVSEGQRVATIISGSSCNSSGGHLHFIVQKNGSTENPFNYLKGIDSENCSGSSCGSGDGDPFNPSGGWNWPIDGPIKFYQGYGATWATKYSWVGRIYNFHNGIDISSSSSEAKAVKSGILYKGSYSVGCLLNYVRVKHKDDGIETLYLHVYN